MQSRLIDLVLFYPLFLFSLSFHEAAHALVADKFGDNTARLLGRVSLSPLPHMDLIGTVFLPIMGILTGAPVIGWGKPVPVNPYRLKGEMRKSNLWVAIAGPASNVLLALLFSGFLHLFLSVKPGALAGLDSLQQTGSFNLDAIIIIIAMQGVVLNLVLAAFNLLPLPPLDGGSVIRGILPEGSLQAFDQFSRYGFVILLALFVTGMLKYILIPVMMVANILLPA
jgi:Zn-dependent protease